MRRLLYSIPAALAAVLFAVPQPVTAVAGLHADAPSPCAPPSALEWHARLNGQEAAVLSGYPVAVAVDLSASAEVLFDDDGNLHYGMAFNDLTEGWSWQPQARLEEEDYYRWKFLPLASVNEVGATYVQEDKIGVPQDTRVERRNDYFLAFDNPQDFYTRERAEFLVRLPSGRLAGQKRMRVVAVARLSGPVLAESTTFWKATHARPVDFTLKKRYLVGQLEALLVCDTDTGLELARAVRSRTLQR